MKPQALQFEIGVKVAYIINKSPLVDEHDFSLTEIVRWMAHSTILFMHNNPVV